MAENLSRAIAAKRKHSAVTNKAKKKNCAAQPLYEIFFSLLKKLAMVLGAMTVA